jgi:hypothetical protein
LSFPYESVVPVSIFKIRVLSVSLFLVNVGRSWSLISWNAGGFYARIKDAGLKSDLSKHEVILVQETQSTRPISLPTHDVWSIPAQPGDNGGRPSGGLAIFVSKSLPYSWVQVATDNANYQVCLLRFENEECLVANVYIRPKCADAFDSILSPLLDVLARYTCPCFVGGDFNARIGDAQMVDPDEEFVSFLPFSNLDRVINENRAGFLSFVEATNLRILNGYSPNPQGQPPPATFTFSSVCSLPPPAPPSTCVVAQSCVDYILASPTHISELSPLEIVAPKYCTHNSRDIILSEAWREP